MKLAKTIRFDKSDLNVFEIVSDEGEWAVSGAFESGMEAVPCAVPREPYLHRQLVGARPRLNRGQI